MIDKTKMNQNNKKGSEIEPKSLGLKRHFHNEYTKIYWESSMFIVFIHHYRLNICQYRLNICQYRLNICLYRLNIRSAPAFVGIL